MYRRTSLPFVLLAALGLLLVTLSAPRALAAAEIVSISKDGVNIRSGPSTDHEVLWEVFKGFPLKVVGRKGKWVQVVDFEGDKGWVYGPLLSKSPTVIVKVDTANMRVGPGTNYEVVAQVKYGVVFTPLERQGEWVKVRHADSTVGWIYAPLLWP